MMMMMIWLLRRLMRMMTMIANDMKVTWANKEPNQKEGETKKDPPQHNWMCYDSVPPATSELAAPPASFRLLPVDISMASGEGGI